MSRLWILPATLAFLALLSVPSTAEARPAKDVSEQIAADALWLRYFEPGKRPFSTPGPFKSLRPKAGTEALTALSRQCQGQLQSCAYGHKVFAGTRPEPKVVQWLFDTLAIAKWADSSPSGSNRYGESWASKIGTDRHSLPRAAGAMAWFKQPKGAAAIANTLTTSKRMTDLFRKECQAPKVFRALWWYGSDGKAQLPTILKALTFHIKGHTGASESGCKRSHVSTFLPYLDTWTLSPAQITQVETFCTGTVLQESVGSTHPKLACLRYMGAIASKNSAVRDFVQNLSTSNDTALQLEAFRAAGRMGLASAKPALKKALSRNYAMQQRNVKKGKRYKKVKVHTWNTGFNAIPAAVALLGMGDKDALNAIKYWLGIDVNGSSLSLASSGHEFLFKEAAFAHPKALKKLRPLLNKWFALVYKGAQKSTSLESPLLKAAIGLSHIGDKNALKVLAQTLKGGDRNKIKHILEAWGGNHKLVVKPGRSTVGLGRFPVGARGYSVSDAKALLGLIQKQFKMWDKSLKSLGITVALGIQAGILATEKKL